MNGGSREAGSGADSRQRRRGLAGLRRGVRADPRPRETAFQFSLIPRDRVTRLNGLTRQAVSVPATREPLGQPPLDHVLGNDASGVDVLATALDAPDDVKTWQAPWYPGMDRPTNDRDNEASDSMERRGAPDPEQLLTALSTEHFTLQGARSQTMSESAARASVYVFAVSSALVALGFIGQVSDVGEVFDVFALTVLPTLYLLGSVTYVRLVECGAEDFRYGLAINRIRHYYKEIARNRAHLFPALRPRRRGRRVREHGPPSRGSQALLRVLQRDPRDQQRRGWSRGRARPRGDP
jgi:hypothetical protein